MGHERKTRVTKICSWSCNHNGTSKLWKVIILPYSRSVCQLSSFIASTSLLLLILMSSCSTINSLDSTRSGKDAFVDQNVFDSIKIPKPDTRLWNRSDPNTTLAELFTSWDPAIQKPIIYGNTMRTWPLLSPNINTSVFTNDPKVISMAESYGWEGYRMQNMSCFGAPDLSQLFKEIIERKRSIFYGFSNVDILFEEGLVKTLTAIRESTEFSKGTLIVVGKRVEVDLSQLNYPSINTTAQVDAISNYANLSRDIYGDYIFTNDLFPWDIIPDFLVGRPLIDKWLIWYARQVGSHVIDASGSIIAVYQKTDGLNKDKLSSCNRDEIKRRKFLPPFPLRESYIECSTHESRMTAAGKVTIHKKKYEYDICSNTQV